jgi:flagellar biosynthesis component FlhA
MLDRIAKIRFELALEATVLLPSVRVVNHSGLDSNSIQIFIGDATIKDHFLPNYCYAVGDVTGYEDCISSATTDPITGERAFLVEVTKATKIKGNRVHLIYPEDVLEFSLKTTFRRYLRELEVLMAQQRPEEVVTESKESEDDEG